jgi:hypothetical protein
MCATAARGAGAARGTFNKSFVWAHLTHFVENAFVRRHNELLIR